MSRARVWASILAVTCLACEPAEQHSNAQVDSEPVELPELKNLEFGRDFVLTNQDGQAFDTSALRGKLIFLFFGYTTCPDACPMTLSKLARVASLLGQEEDQIQIVYVSVDPERDTVEKLKEYLSYYQLPVIGLTGTAEEIKSVAGDFGVFYSKSEEETAMGYLVDHTTLIYLVDGKGSLRYLSHPEDSPEVLAGLARKVLGEG